MDLVPNIEQELVYTVYKRRGIAFFFTFEDVLNG
jgi:hypothetical protein